MFQYGSDCLRQFATKKKKTKDPFKKGPWKNYSKQDLHQLLQNNQEELKLLKKKLKGAENEVERLGKLATKWEAKFDEEKERFELDLAREKEEHKKFIMERDKWITEHNNILSRALTARTEHNNLLDRVITRVSDVKDRVEDMLM